MDSGVLNKNSSFTRIEHEKDIEFNAPHRYEVITENETRVGRIFFQFGPIKENGVNGVTNEDLLSIVIDRLSHFQKSRYKCTENEKALERIIEGLMWLNKRTEERSRRGVEGTSNL